MKQMLAEIAARNLKIDYSANVANLVYRLFSRFVPYQKFPGKQTEFLTRAFEKAAKERGIDCEVDNTDLSSAKGTDADAVFTSQELGDELKGSTKAPVYPIQRYMDKEEVGKALDDFLSSKE